MAVPVAWSFKRREILSWACPIAWSNCKTYHFKVANHGTVKTTKQTGRPEKFDQNDIDILVAASEVKGIKTLTEIIERSGLDMCTRTASKLLKHGGITNWDAKRMPLLTGIIYSLIYDILMSTWLV